MHRALAAAILVFGLFQTSNAYCCFRDPLMLTPKCGCPDLDTCGIVKCPKSCANTCACDCGQSAYLGSSLCACGLPACSCYRDTSNVCYVCDQPSPMCSCLKAAGECRCKCETKKSFIYFPEVEYPVTVMEMKPYYYAGCYTY